MNAYIFTRSGIIAVRGGPVVRDLREAASMDASLAARLVGMTTGGRPGFFLN